MRDETDFPSHSYLQRGLTFRHTTLVVSFLASIDSFIFQRHVTAGTKDWSWTDLHLVDQVRQSRPVSESVAHDGLSCRKSLRKSVGLSSGVFGSETLNDYLSDYLLDNRFRLSGFGTTRIGRRQAKEHTRLPN